MQRFAQRKDIQYVPEEIAQDAVQVRVGGVQLATGRLDAVLAPGLLIHADCQLAQAGSFTPLPAVASVRRSVQLHNDAYSTQTCILQ